jgi:hypothetical protein
MIDVVADVTHTLDADATKLVTRKTDIETKIATLEGQIDALRAELVDIAVQEDYLARIRQFVTNLAGGVLFGALTVFAAPPATGATTPLEPGLTRS